MASVLRIFLPKILFKVTWNGWRIQVFLQEKLFSGLCAHIQWGNLKEGHFGLNLPLSKNAAFEFKLLT